MWASEGTALCSVQMSLVKAFLIWPLKAVAPLSYMYWGEFATRYTTVIGGLRENYINGHLEDAADYQPVGGHDGEVYYQQQDVLKQLQEANKEVQLRLERLEKGGGAASTAGGSTAPPSEVGRQPALIIGGWDPEQEAQETKQAVEDILRSVQAPIHVDSLFVPGIRRGYAILPINENPGETVDMRRKRIQEVITKVRDANVVLGARPEGGQRKVWIAMSQPPERRRRSRMAAKVKRLFLSLGGQKDQLEVEYSSGSAWVRSGGNTVRVCSTTASRPPTAEEAGPGWVIAKALRKSTAEGEQPLESQFWGFSWNVGGLTASNALQVLENLRGKAYFDRIQLVMFQEIITNAGNKHAESDHWQIVYGKVEGEFRGEAIAHRSHHKHQQTTILPGAILTTICTATTRLRVLSGHIPHHATIPQTEDMLQQWGYALAKHKLVLGVDANETFRPPLHNTEGGYACTGRGDSILSWMASQDIRLPPQDLSTPTYHPYNLSHQPRRLDYVAVRGVTAGSGEVIACRDAAASDHDGVSIPLCIHKGARGRTSADCASKNTERGKSNLQNKQPPSPFTMHELAVTSHNWQHNKSTGPDGVSHEAYSPIWRGNSSKMDCPSTPPKRRYSTVTARGGEFTIQGEAVQCQHHGTTIPVLGSPLTFGDQTAAIVGEMARRARAAFGKHKRVLKARTSIKPRLVAYNTLVRNAALYAAESWPAHQQLLHAANSIQILHMRELLQMRRRPAEEWGEWHARTLRLARVHLHRERVERWSTHILGRIWRLWGHLARAEEEVTAMLRWKNLHFWRAQQQLPARQRVKHAGRFNPGGDVERALESIAGTNWGEVAQADNRHYATTCTPTRDNKHPPQQAAQVPPQQWAQPPVPQHTGATIQQAGASQAPPQGSSATAYHPAATAAVQEYMSRAWGDSIEWGGYDPNAAAAAADPWEESGTHQDNPSQQANWPQCSDSPSTTKLVTSLCRAPQWLPPPGGDTTYRLNCHSPQQGDKPPNPHSHSNRQQPTAPKQQRDKLMLESSLATNQNKRRGTCHPPAPPQQEQGDWGGHDPRAASSSQTPPHMQPPGGTSKRRTPAAPHRGQEQEETAAATPKRDAGRLYLPPGAKGLPGMTMREHYILATTGVVPQSYVERVLAPAAAEEEDEHERMQQQQQQQRETNHPSQGDAAPREPEQASESTKEEGRCQAQNLQQAGGSKEYTYYESPPTGGEQGPSRHLQATKGTATNSKESSSSTGKGRGRTKEHKQTQRGTPTTREHPNPGETPMLTRPSRAPAAQAHNKKPHSSKSSTRPGPIKLDKPTPGDTHNARTGVKAPTRGGRKPGPTEQRPAALANNKTLRSSSGNSRGPTRHHKQTQPGEHTHQSSETVGTSEGGGESNTEGEAPQPGDNTASRLEADSLALAVSHQIQLIHDAAGSLQGGPSATITAFCDVAASLLSMMYPTGIVPDTCKRGRKRGICNANYLVDALSSFTHHLHGGGRKLTREEWQQDLSYLIRVLEEGAVQLHEPMPAAVSVQQLQWGTRCLQRAIMLLTAALDSSLRGDGCWNTPKLWGELRDLTTPAAVLLEQREDSEDRQQRGASSGSAEGPRQVHPADVLQLAQGHEEGGPRTRTSSTAAQLLFEAAGEFRKLMPTLVDEQVPLAVQLLHAVEAKGKWPLPKGRRLKLGTATTTHR
ncbi:unnamed protein product [Symbiodinium sp. KB8]|nr:unnamed protein product [Symbiodinium sp. KB8]